MHGVNVTAYARHHGGRRHSAHTRCTGCGCSCGSPAGNSEVKILVNMIAIIIVGTHAAAGGAPVDGEAVINVVERSVHDCDVETMGVILYAVWRQLHLELFVKKKTTLNVKQVQ